MRGGMVIVMGVAGSGKTTIGQALASRLGWGFQDADELHPRANIARMAAGHPLTDADRAPWLAVLRDWVRSMLGAGRNAVLAASLLKRAYRDKVIGGDSRVRLIYLQGGHDLLLHRMQGRHTHFMPPGLLDSQLDTLEAPGDEEHALVIDVGGTVDATVAAVVDGLSAGQGLLRR